MAKPSEFKMLAQEMRTGFASMHARLDGLEKEMRDGFASVSDKLDGIGQYLIVIDRNLESVDDRVGRLEDRWKEAG